MLVAPLDTKMPRGPRNYTTASTSNSCNSPFSLEAGILERGGKLQHSEPKTAPKHSQVVNSSPQALPPFDAPLTQDREAQEQGLARTGL